MNSRRVRVTRNETFRGRGAIVFEAREAKISRTEKLASHDATYDYEYNSLYVGT